MNTGDDLKDQGIRLVSDNNDMWFINSVHAYNKWSRDKVGVCVTGESIRRMLSFQGFVPKHPNAWGALINHLVRQERLKPTGDWMKPEDPKSHSRPTKLYEVVS